ncbi:hypothetical protein L2E82_38510 [Cichorium intybus]|uniref:Uncharacterized protein n=1 Tax=Cichorium intybus TaxID=13427 RepID=A0ACB9AFC6_CICIN|nr:hypothetical protein L2E82_38510 [Cichorium intybus]
MAEVVVSLDSILVLQQKTNSSLQPAGRTIFGRMVDRLVFTSNGENSARGDPSNSKANSRNAAGDSVGFDNKDLSIPILTLKCDSLRDWQIVVPKLGRISMQNWGVLIWKDLTMKHIVVGTDFHLIWVPLVILTQCTCIRVT